MSGWFDQLKEIVNINFNLHIFSQTHIHIGSDNSHPAVYNQERDILVLNPSALPPELNSRLKPILQEFVNSGDGLLVEKRSSDIIRDISSEESSNREFLSFFKGKISREDFAALRAAMYLNKCFRDGSSKEKILTMKQGIVERYGARGNKISNLYSAGIFENTIKPLYEEMAKYAGFDEDDFLRYYDQIIEQEAFTVFASSYMTVDVLRDAIERKIKTNKRYGAKYVTVRGIGRNIIEMITEVISEFEMEGFYPRPPSITIKDNIIEATLWFS